jgi:hypothetical protein
MKYTVIENFTDLQDNNYKYQAGDSFPRDGYDVSKARIEELSTNKNRRNRPMIKAIEEIEPEVEPEVEVKSTKKGSKKNAK